MATSEEIAEAQAEIERRRRVREAQAELDRRRAAQALPLPVPPAEVPVFAPRETEMEASAREGQAALEQEELRLPSPGEVPGARIEEARAELERRRRGAETSVQAGSPAVTEEGSFMFPTFRPSRIRELPAAEAAAATAGTPGSAQEMTDNQLRTAILASAEGPRLTELSKELRAREQGAAQELRAKPTADVFAMARPPAGAPEGVRLYRDPDTGELRPPTAGEELWEALAKQPVMTAAAAKGAAERIAQSEKELQRRAAAGEDVGWFEFAGPAFSGILSTADETGPGTVETELGAALRSGLGTLSTLAAEGYFRGLGYEVDKNGIPKDPDDFGLAVANLRKRAGLPAVVSSLEVAPLTAAVTAAVRQVSPEAGATVERALLSIPQLAIPLPGVATESTEREPTSKDPEGRRRVSGVEVPSLLDDPRGFIEAESRRVARNIASGRTFADEFFDSPETREWYANVYGDEEAAFWAGAVSEIAIPAGPGTLARAAKGAAGAAAKSTLATKAADAFIRADLPGSSVVAAVVPGRASDGRIVRRVAEKVINDLAIDPAVMRQAKAAIRPTSNTFDEVMDDVGPIVDPAYRSPWAGAVSAGEGTEASLRAVREGDLAAPAKRFYTQLVRSVPDDLVLVTDNVAVPRALAGQARKIAIEGRQAATQRTNVEALADLAAIRRALGSAPPQASKYLDQAEKFLRESVARGERFVSTADRRLVDAYSRAASQPVNAALASVGSPIRLRANVTARSVSEIEDALGQGSELARRLTTPTSSGGVAVDNQVLDQVINELANRELLRRLPQQVRYTRDLTDAQVYLRNIGTSLERLVGQGPTARRLRAVAPSVRGVFGAPRVETAASAKIARDLGAAAQATVRQLGKDLAERAGASKSVDEALDQLMFEKVFGNGLSSRPVEEVWLKVLEAIYKSPEKAREVYGKARAASNIGVDAVPTMAAVRAVDRGFSGPGLLVEYEKAMLKVILEEGIRKQLAKTYKDRDLVEAGVDEMLTSATTGAVRTPAEISDRLRGLGFNPADTRTAEVENIFPGTVRTRVYDPITSRLEKVLGESGEEFVQFIETVEPRGRGPLLEMARAAFENVVTGFGRNVETSAKYGYILPNIPYVAGRSLFPVIMSLVTSGLRNTSDALAQVVNRRLAGGPLYTKDGRVFTPAELDELANTSGLGITATDTQRIGSLSDDILYDAFKAMRAAKIGGVTGKLLAGAFDEINPVTKVMGQRIAEAAEVSFRRGVFEARLVEGDTVSQAAEAARRSALDYSEVPGPVRDFVGRFIADAAQNWQLTVELVRLARSNPKAATVFYKSLQAKTREQDPYGVHGDRGLKSMGFVGIDEQDYYVPGFGGAYVPLEVLIASSKAPNEFLATMARSADLEQRDAMATVFEGGTELVRSGIDAALPLLRDLIEASEAAQDDTYRSTDVPRAKVMSDEGAFWAAAVAAHHADPDRSRGHWRAFTTVFQPEFVLPPAEMAAYPGAKDERKQYWKARPEGMPYLVWGQDVETNETVYKAMQPSAEGQFNLQLLRKAPFADLAQKLGWYYASMADTSTKAVTAPLEVRPEGVVPRVGFDKPETVARWFLAPAPTAAEERARQAAALAAGGAEAQ